MQKIRNWTTGWIAGVILGLIIITFAVWGINFNDQGSEIVVASVNGEDIKISQFQRIYANFHQRMRQHQDRGFTADEERKLKEQTLDKLIEHKVIYQAAVDNGIYISNEQVIEAIKAIEAFDSANGFDFIKYESSLMQLGMSPSAFENQLRSELMTDKLQNIVKNSAFALAQEAKWLARFKEQTRDLSYVLLSADELKESVTVDDEAITEFYNSEAPELLSEEQVKIAYLELSVDGLAQDVAVTEEELATYYDNNKDRYDEPEQRKVSVVDVDLPADAGDEQIAAANEKLEKIRELIVSGISFTDIAEKHDDGSEPKMLVSEHGYLARGVLPADIDGIIFAMDEGELSNIERTERGLHIFKVDAIKGGDKNTLEYVREAVVKDYQRSKAEREYFKLADQLVTLTYEHPETLEIAADLTGIDIQESDFFSRTTVATKLSDPKILAASFDQQAITSGQNSEAIELGDEQLVILRVLEYLPAVKRPLEDVREQIILILKSDEASKMQQQKAQDILARLNEGLDLVQISEEFGFEWQEAGAVDRNDVSVNRTILREAFKMDKPVAGGKIFSAVAVGKSDHAVIIVSAIRYPEELAELEESRSLLLQSKADSEWTAFADELVGRARISINSNSL